MFFLSMNICQKLIKTFTSADKDQTNRTLINSGLKPDLRLGRPGVNDNQ
jgi:hypothetical protein